MANSIELREQRAALVADSRKLLDKAEAEGRELNAEENAEWERRMIDVDKLEAEINKAEKRERLEHVEAELKNSTGRKTAPAATTTTRDGHRLAVTKADRDKAWKAWLGHGIPGVRLDGDVLNRAAELGMPVHQSSIEYRSLNTASSSTGGDTTFTTTSPDVQKELKYYSPILGKCTIRQTADGNTFTIPRATDVANSVAIVSQSGSSATNVDPSFDKVSFGATMFRTVVQVTYEMLQDSVFDVEGYVTDTLNERFARTVEKYIVAGTGSSQPTGLITAAASGTTVTLAATKKSLYQFEDLFALFKAVDLAYRPNCTLVLHDSSVWDLRGIKDSNGRYLWDINNSLVQNAQPDKIAGFNYLISNSVDASGSFSKKIGVFADLSRMNVRIVNGVQITRLNELYRANGMVGFEAVMRFDSNYLGHAASIALLATPAS